jgi:hypothetical protein
MNATEWLGLKPMSIFHYLLNKARDVTETCGDTAVTGRHHTDLKETVKEA